MNYLAHAYLSFNREPILLGNMISDYIKGKKKFEYPEAVQKGISLHREIDTFTDCHPSTKSAEQFLKPVVGRYAGAFTDVIYDHFLALDTNEFENDQCLMDFTQTTYSILEPSQYLFPEKFKKMFPYMQSQNWLYNYQFNWGIERSFEGLVRRAAYLDSSAEAFMVFEKEYDQFRSCYASFFPELKKYTLQRLQEMN